MSKPAAPSISSLTADAVMQRALSKRSESPLIYPGFLGRGWKFPPSFSRATATVDLVEADRDIREAIWIILSTSLGERVMLPRFGCNLKSMVFTSLTVTSANEMGRLVTTAITNWEPRVTVLSTAVSEAEIDGWIAISIDYLVRQTNARSNLVYPFYLTEVSLPAAPT